jgi:hypothetical protein
MTPSSALRLLVFSSAFVLGSLSSAARADDPWEAFRFLIGEWVSAGDPAQGTGKFSLRTDLQNHVLVRRNHADVPATGGRPAASHEDLMVIYAGEAGKPVKAIYFDSEGHVINYAVTRSDDKKTLTFLSDPSTSSARFRLSYVKESDDLVSIKFEIAPPGQPDAFKTYLEGKARRVKP